VFIAAMREWNRAVSSSAGDPTASVSLSERIERVMQITLAREMDRAERYMTFLATTGSTAPFIGLFGTVWGIMNSFQALGNVNQATLAMVAPGISEALIATAMGLFAAIPAVIGFNSFSTRIDHIYGRSELFIEEFLAILQRQARD